MTLSRESKSLLQALLSVSRGEAPAGPTLHELIERGLATSGPISLTDAGEHATSDLLVEDSDIDPVEVGRGNGYESQLIR